MLCFTLSLQRILYPKFQAYGHFISPSMYLKKKKPIYMWKKFLKIGPRRRSVCSLISTSINSSKQKWYLQKRNSWNLATTGNELCLIWFVNMKKFDTFSNIFQIFEHSYSICQIFSFISYGTSGTKPTGPLFLCQQIFAYFCTFSIIFCIRIQVLAGFYGSR